MSTTNNWRIVIRNVMLINVCFASCSLVYADIKHLQKMHFVLYDELHSFLTERQSAAAANAVNAGQAGAAGAGGGKGHVLVEAAMH